MLRKLLSIQLSNREKRLVAVVVPALLIGAWLPGRISVSTSPSLHHRIFFLSAAPDTSRIKNGDYIVFQQDGKRLIKIVGCAPGEWLDVHRGEYFCGDRFLGKALTRDSKGNPLPRFVYKGVVPPGNFFMTGEHVQSYDSRYTGFVHADDVEYKAYPLWPIW
ncbi:hypothetical protein GF1_16460 [Desulfolithobacter dissulfuricans]|uniref:Peptidase S26 domain-containing protein n=1 Tax=Desulfolithobacter dissulfuricans TaxID=2795293 RepID=A0A915U1X6_9BACT|nr:S26 family signal peptidase [Desulfolithobacter dissulfuricans]BCO09270.1 hypothetical protein GF1_16460 [Desulfolithobacter dissulfuricans]